MWSISVPLLQSEEGCPKGGVVGEKEFLILMINRFFIVLPGRMRDLTILLCAPSRQGGELRKVEISQEHKMKLEIRERQEI